MKISSKKSALIIGDIFRTHTRLTGGKYGVSTTKLAHLLRGGLAAQSYDVRVVEDRHSPEISEIYHCFFGDVQDVYTWALRSQVLSHSLRDFYSLILGDDCLVIGFELPESLWSYCGEKGILVLDFAFHFVRFEADYTMMVRSNSADVEKALKTIRHKTEPLDILQSTAQTSASPELEDIDEIKLFLMQTRFDRSKFDGNGGILNDLDLIRGNKITLDFYKPHPMEHRPELELCLQGAGVMALPWAGNIYSFLACYGYKTKVVSVSSGLLAEADMIGVQSAEMLSGFPWIVDGYEKYSRQVASETVPFIPVSHTVFNRDFMAAIVAGSSWSPDRISISKFNLKEYWNVKWS